MKIKVCGMRDVDNAWQVAQLGVDMMGFIFYPKSPRYFGDCMEREFPLPRKKNGELVERVGVFVNDTFERFIVLRLGCGAVSW